MAAWRHLPGGSRVVLTSFFGDCFRGCIDRRGGWSALEQLLYSPGMAGITRSSRMLGRLGAPPSGLVMRVGFNGLAQLAPVVVAFALTPLLLSRLGLDRFGIWSLALVILATLTALDGGVSASLARFFAVYAARADREDTGRLLVGSLLFFLLLGVGLTLAAWPIAPAIAGLLDIPERLNGEAVVVIRWLPPLSALALMAASTSALLQGNGQFRALAATMLASSGIFAVAVIVLVQPGGHLRALMVATGVRYVAQVGASLLFAAKNVSIRRPLLPSRATMREFRGYASWMQLTALTGFVTVQMDAFVIAAVLPIRYVGLYSIGMQAATAARSLPLYAFAPLLTRLTTTFRSGGREATAAEFERLERRWLPAVLAYGAVAVAAIGFSVPVWLGNGYVLSGVVATILLAGYVVHVGLTGLRTCYARAVGRPGLETRYALVWTVANAVLTIPFALAAGVVGVVTATAVTALMASVYFVALCRRTERLSVIVPGKRWWRVAAVAVGITIAGEIAIVQTSLHGFFALALTGLPALAGLAIFAAALRQAPALVMSRDLDRPAGRL
jgi:O-antigen/teichoic acid export membrane protein